MKELAKLNPLLKDLELLRRKNNAEVTLVVKKIEDGNDIQGVEGESYEIYKVADIYVKIKISTDSYGDNERITGLEFVKPIVKQVTDFESI